MPDIIRVFPRRNSYTPTDDMAFYGLPPFPEFLPPHDEVHVSCTFTWDKAECEMLRYQWEAVTDKPVKLGGPAYGSCADDFVQGRYLKSNIIFTTRGCNNNCPWCIVPKIEGRLKELPICQGNVIQDNNFLQASRAHKNKVFEMLKTQTGICFKGGLECALIDDHFVEAVRGLRIKELWLACDCDLAVSKFKKAAAKLSPYFTRHQLKCYVMIGDDKDENEARLREVYNAGAMPFAMLKRDFGDKINRYSNDWERFARQWQRPAAIKAHMRRGTSYKDFNK